MKISPNFTREEFACTCGCGFNTVDVDLVAVAEHIRSYIGAYSPTSGCRCHGLNLKVGGSPESQHLLGRAMDVAYENPEELYNFLNINYPNKYGIGLYSWGIHIDTRDRKARWDSR